MSLTEPRWGIRFDRPAAEAGGLGLIDGPMPAVLTIPLEQGGCPPEQLLIDCGDHVMTGQPIARGPAGTIHASGTGRVIAIDAFPVTGARSAVCARLETTGEEQHYPGYAMDAVGLSPDELRALISEAGIVGLGGAAFPAAAKLAGDRGIHTLILNGVECEPRISCDDALMQTAAAEMLAGASIMLRITGAQQCIVAVKENSPAIPSVRAAIAAGTDDRISLRSVPAIYPAGGELQLIELLTGLEVPADGLPWDIGLLCHNVGTAAAIHDFFFRGQPLISRIVSVTGSGVRAPVDIRARIGTPVSALIAAAGGYTSEPARLIMGGPMMGIALDSDDLPVSKACNSIYVPAQRALPPVRPELPCIRCGDCAVACPANLLPQLLLVAHKVNDADRLNGLGLADCIECGCCDYVCPSNIPLTRTFVRAKHELADFATRRQRADAAAARYSAHQDRLQQRDQDDDAHLADSSVDNEHLQALLQRTGVVNDKDQAKDRER